MSPGSGSDPRARWAVRTALLVPLTLAFAVWARTSGSALLGFALVMVATPFAMAALELRAGRRFAWFPCLLTAGWGVRLAIEIFLYPPLVIGMVAIELGGTLQRILGLGYPAGDMIGPRTFGSGVCVTTMGLALNLFVIVVLGAITWPIVWGVRRLIRASAG